MIVRPTRPALILTAMLLFRISTSMGPLAILLTVTRQHSLAVASISLTFWTLAGALSQPFWIAVMERFNQRVVLICLGLATSVFHASIMIDATPYWSVMAACAAGATLPPITSQARTLLAALLEGGQLKSAYDTESALASSAFVIAPLIVGAASFAGTMGPLAGCGLLLLIVSIAYAYIGRPASEKSPPHPEPIDQPNGKRPRIYRPATILVASGTLAYATLACIEVAAVARLDGSSAVALVLSAWAAVSVLSGFVLARLRSRDSIRTFLLPIPIIASALMAVVTKSHLPVFVALLVLSGIAVAPTLALITSEVARITPSAYHSRTFGWLQAGSWLGSAAATAFAGILATSNLSLLLVVSALLALITIVLLRAPGLRGTKLRDTYQQSNTPER